MGSMHHIQVGDHHFVLNDDDVSKLASPFLTTLIDPTSPFARPENGVNTVHADSACFSSFLLLARHGVWTQLHADRDHILQEADFWGIREEIQEQIRIADNNWEELLQAKNRTVELLEDVIDSTKTHHSFRYDQGDRWICCTSCRIMHIVERDSYSTCIRCKRKVVCKNDLGWCHKCSMCHNCQPIDCQNDKAFTRYPTRKKPTLRELEAELILAKESLAKFSLTKSKSDEAA